MPIPDYQSLMLPVLRITSDGRDHALTEIRAQVATDLRLTPEELRERLASDTQPVFSNRMAWAVQYLKAAGALQTVERGVYKITDRGCTLLQTNPSAVTARTLSQFAEFSEFYGRPSASPAVESHAAETSLADTPEEAVDRNFRLQRETLVSDLSDAMQNGTPAAFEKLVVNFLVAMGYGAPDDDSPGSVVGGTSDGGIDGIVKQDRLGLDAIYIQAKRWKENVGIQEVMKFSGALTKRHATRGVFITSSGFSRDALNYVEALPQKIVLIDGKRLASLMIDYNVGVAATKTYVLKRVDPAYFESL
jgi:restriction system protein